MSLIVATPKRRRPRFHPLRIAHLERLTDHAVALTFDVPSELREEFAFEPGQYLTLRAQIEGADVRRSYSICMSRRAFAQSGQLRVASARVEQGAMSNWLNDHADVGQSLDVMTPMGEFMNATEAGSVRHHVAVAAGSGITPVLSLLWSVLEEEPRSRMTLIFGNKRTDSVMFREELNALQDRFPDRFTLIHVLSQESSDMAALSGRIDQSRMRALIEDRVPVDAVDDWYLCGPHPMVKGVQAVLAAEGVDERHVHQEIFHREDGA